MVCHPRPGAMLTEGDLRDHLCQVLQSIKVPQIHCCSRTADRSGSLRNPTALAEFDRGFADALKVRTDLWIGVQISLYLSADLIPGLAFEAREEIVDVGVGG